MSLPDALRAEASMLEQHATTLRAFADHLDAQTAVTEPHLYTVRDVAERLGVHPNTVYEMIREGALDGTKVRGQWRIYPSSLARSLIRSVS